MSAVKKALILASTVGIAFALVACSSSTTSEAGSSSSPSAAGPVSTAAEEPTPAVSEAPFDLEAFCVVAVPRLEPILTSEFGGEAHVERFEAMLDVAPADLVDALQTLHDYYDVSVSPDDPESQDPDSWPQAIRDAGAKVASAIRERCDVPE